MMTTDTECQRCGTCCKAGGPALHLADMELVQSGRLLLKDLYTIRKGELARDNVKGTLEPMPAELIKVKGIGRIWTCCYYDAEPKGCRVYADRPLECRVLNCRDTAAIEAIYAEKRLTRNDLLAEVPQLWELVAEHEKKCSYADLADLSARVQTGKDPEAVDRFKETVGYDTHLRALIRESGRPDPALLEFLFGRPLADTLPGFGLQVRQEKDRFVVTPRL